MSHFAIFEEHSQSDIDPINNIIADSNYKFKKYLDSNSRIHLMKKDDSELLSDDQKIEFDEN